MSRSPRRVPARWSAPLLALVLAGGLSACSADEPAEVARPAETTTYSAGEVPVLRPGAPGESAKVVAPGQSDTRANAAAYRDEDVTFVNGMVPHHAQALEMASLAPERAADDRVERLAERIAAGQGPEIRSMQAWLAAQGLSEASEDAGHSSHAGHGAAGMRGMATPEEMARLMASRGPAFDRMFLELMTRHHEGAIAMAEQAVGAAHPIVSEMVDDVVATQAVEIRRMQDLLRQLPA